MPIKKYNTVEEKQAAIKEASERSNKKLFKCEICDLEIKRSSRTNHLVSNKHITNVNNIKEAALKEDKTFN
jgi:hypothetical protein